MKTIEWEEDEITHQLPAKNVVCDDCGGEGTTLNENLRGGFTMEEFHECFDDEESREQYFLGGDGIYGVTCKTCRGNKVVPVVDEDRVEPELLKRWQKSERERREDERADAYTRWAEDGYRRD